MSLQRILNQSNDIVINRRRVIGVQYTRNEILRTAETPTLNPWKFTVTSSNGFVYSEVRDMLEQLDWIDRRIPETITFSDNPNFNWMFRYQGDMVQADIDAIVVDSFSGNQLVLGNLPALLDTAVLFRPNDIIQIGNNYFPFTSVNTVTRGLASTVTVTTHRPNVIANSVVNSNIVVGSQVRFNMLCMNMPTYKLIPGARRINSLGEITNNAIVEFNDPFEFVEYLG